MGIKLSTLPENVQQQIRAQGKRSVATSQAKARTKANPMNKWEQAYANELHGRKLRGEIIEFAFEPMKLKLAPSTYYTPDFMVIDADRTISIHEVKGFWRDDARVKIKVAAEQFPWFRFVAVTQEKGAWKYEWFK